MSHILRSDVERAIVTIEFHGALPAEAISSGFAEGLALAHQNAWTRVLSDCVQATLQLSTLQIYALPDLLAHRYAERELSVFECRHAIVCANNIDDFRFMETMLKNRSHTAAMFTDINEAIDWLMAGSIDF